MLNLCFVKFYWSDCHSRHSDTASVERPDNVTFTVSVQMWHRWVMTFMHFLVYDHYSCYFLLPNLVLLLLIPVVVHNLLPLSMFLLDPYFSFFFHFCTYCVFISPWLYLAIHSSGGGRHCYHHYHYCCYIYKVLF